MSDKKFYVYSKDGCGFCERLTAFMEQKGLNYEKFNLGDDFTSNDFLNKFGRASTFPQVVMENKHLGGLKDTVTYLMKNKMV
tara:strand:+ start:987 stop:1232 length:246 start_codon:yes stop_codon:yes gene_type:complete